MDGNTAAKGGEGRRMAAKAMVVAGVGILATAAMNLPPSAALRRLSPPDIHSEYVKFLSGKDTVTAYIAYPERPQAAPANDVGIIGFCWGGGQSFRYATNSPELKAFVVCYGPSPNPADMAKIRAKGLGVYAENDARIDAGLPDAAAAMRAAGKDYPYTVYPGVGHGFLRTREKPEVADSAWNAVIRFFRAQLKS